MSVKREAGKVWIEGVPNLIESERAFCLLERTAKTCTFASALEAALAVTEHPYSYEDIMALSGMAFRVRWYDGENGPTGCPCSPTGESPDVLKSVSAATGWQLEHFFQDGWGTPLMQQVIPKITQSVDSARPALVVDKHLNSSVVYGYINQGQAFLLRTHEDGSYECPISELGQNPALAILLQGHAEAPRFTRSFKDTLQEAVERWYLEKANIFPCEELKNGKAALEAWIRFFDLLDELVAKEDPRKLLTNHLWNYKHLYDARQAAASFLHKHAAVYPSAQEESVQAGELYQQEADVLGSAYEDDVTFLGTFDYEALDMDQWTPQARQREQEIMKQAYGLEQLAIQALAKTVTKISSAE